MLLPVVLSFSLLLCFSFLLWALCELCVKKTVYFKRDSARKTGASSSTAKDFYVAPCFSTASLRILRGAKMPPLRAALHETFEQP
jgi:hypothetical protein